MWQERLVYGVFFLSRILNYFCVLSKVFFVHENLKYLKKNLRATRRHLGLP